MTPVPPPIREHWGSRLGFLLAAAGSAIGLGNLWGFPYKASAHGGAAFVLVYMVVILLVALPLLLAELVIGRHTGESPVLALVRLGGPRWRWLGYAFVLNAVMILAFYSVVTGWTLLSLGRSLAVGLPPDPAAFFAGISQGPQAVFGHLLAMALTGLVIAGGVRCGIERLSLWFMPLLFVVLVALALWAATFSGAGAGYRFYLQPDFTDLLRWPTITAAAGHAFFSLSVGMGAMVTYASYLRGQENLVRLGSTIALADTGVALVGGLITFPLVSHFQLLGKLSDSTVGTLFVAIPSGMASLGPAGRPITVFFFLVLAIAALTSAVSLLEVATAGLIDRLGWSRLRATWSAGLTVTALGLLPALDNRWIDVFYSLCGEALLLLGGLMMALLLGWLHPALGRRELALGFGEQHSPSGDAHSGPFPWPILWWMRVLRFLAPPMLAVLLWQSLRHLPAVFQPLLVS
ncbi:MAG: sodium-dependent transporter [Cyanobium sp.]